MRRMFARLGEISRNTAVPVLVAYLALIEIDAARVRDIVEENGLLFLDVSSSFKDRNIEDYMILIGDAHPNERAHKIFADRIYGALTEERLLPPHEGR